MERHRIKKGIKVIVVSERRADYSRFKPILSLMRKDPFFSVKLVVTGICLLPEYGEDISFIKKSSKIDAVIPMFQENAPDSGAEMTRAYARVMAGLSDYVEKERPDLILAGFDIGANFAAAVVGAHQNIHVAHVQGGEVTGSIDESLRHAISKFAHIHFPATKDAARRLARMGEDPRFTFPVGCPSVDTLLLAPQMTRIETAQILGVNPKEPYALIIEHPVTTEMESSGRQMSETIAAVEKFGIQAVALFPNNDAGTRAVISKLKASRVQVLRSLPPDVFANALRHAAVLLGNSSTGIHESATFRIPTINIGTRQKGRERSGNVLDVGYDRAEILRALKTVFSNTMFQDKVRRSKNIYGDGKAAERIVQVLRSLDLSQVPIQKRFVE